MYLARLRLAMISEEEVSVGAECFFDLVDLDLAGEGCCCCCSDLDERERRKGNLLNPVRFTVGSSEGIGGIGICAYADGLGGGSGLETGGI